MKHARSIIVAAAIVSAIGLDWRTANADSQQCGVNPGLNMYCEQGEGDCAEFGAQTVCESIILHQKQCSGAVYFAVCESDGSCPTGNQVRCYWSPLG